MSPLDMCENKVMFLLQFIGAHVIFYSSLSWKTNTANIEIEID